MYNILPAQLAAPITDTILLATRRDIVTANLNISSSTLYETISSSATYKGPVKLRILMVGTATSPGATAFDGSRPAAASGESALFEGSIETGVNSIVLTQWGHSNGSISASNGSYMNLCINNIINLKVGSANGSSGYGNGGCPYPFSANTSVPPGFTRLAYGAKRCSDSTNYYSDSTNYAPESQATYGSASNIPLDFNLGSASVRAYFNKGATHTLETGAIIDGIKYGNAVQCQYGGSPNSGSRSPDYAGCVLIEVTPLRNLKIKSAPRRLPQVSTL